MKKIYYLYRINFYKKFNKEKKIQKYIILSYLALRDILKISLKEVLKIKSTYVKKL